MRKYVLDTNLYIGAFRGREAAVALERFFYAHTPGVYLSSIVLHELLLCANTPAKARQIEEDIARPLERAGRVLTPSHKIWERAANTLARMAREEKVELRRIPKSLVNDFLLAFSCRDAGATLITDNTRDFERIRRFLRFEFLSPWPG